MPRDIPTISPRTSLQYSSDGEGSGRYFRAKFSCEVRHYSFLSGTFLTFVVLCVIEPLSFAIGDTSVSLQLLRVRVYLAVTGIQHLAVRVVGSTSAEIPIEREADDTDDHDAQIHQEHYGHPFEPHCIVHLPREPAQHAEHRAAAPRELRVGVTADAVRLAGPFAGQAQVMA